MLEHVPNKTIKSKYVNMFFADIQFSHELMCRMCLENLLDQSWTKTKCILSTHNGARKLFFCHLSNIICFVILGELF